MNFVSKFPNKTTVGRCIYCGTTDEPLHKEHIVPYCLGGSFILHRATCPNCEKITREFEYCVTTEQALVIRTVMNLPTRRKGRRPQTIPLKVTKAGQKMTIDCPIELYPMRLTLAVYTPPAYIDRRSYKKGIDWRGIVTVGPPVKLIERLRETFQIDDFSSTISLQGLTQARLLAKIALGFAVAKYGSRVIEHAYIRRAILGQSEDIGKWVGCISRSSTATNLLHEVTLSVGKDNNIYAYVRLFAKYKTPEYLVVVGPTP